MLIGICGSICAGKHTTAEYLVQHHGFLRLHLPTRLVWSRQDQDQDQDQNQNQNQNQNQSTVNGTSTGSAGSKLEKRLLPSVTDQKGTRGLTFPDVNALIDFVTKRWREHWVLTDIYDQATLEVLLRRPFFLLLSIDAPISLRYERFSARCLMRELEPMSLNEFVLTNDLQMYGSGSGSGSGSQSQQSQSESASGSGSPIAIGIAHLLPQAHLQILNQQHSIPAYYAFLHTLDLPSPIRLRPTWDAYFMTLASLASLRSNCMKRRVGCVLVHNSRIISTGYNGTPRNLTNCNEGGCRRCNSNSAAGGAALSTCLCLHAEENALLEAGRERIRQGSILYCDTCPCLTCSVKIAQVGVKEVVYSQTYNMDDASRQVLNEAGVVLRQFSLPPRSGLISGAAGAAGAEFKSRDLVVLNNTK